MKKIILTTTFLLIFSLAANADITPQYLNSVSHWGIGVATAGKDIKIYDANNSQAKLKANIIWDEKGNVECKNTNMNCEAREIFLGFSPENSTALFSVEDETDGWIFICYNQRFRLFGWIKKDDYTKYLNWNEFLISYGKKYGMYLFRDVPKSYKRLYAAPNIESGCVDSFFLATHINPWLVSGNWILVKVENYDDTQKTGWLRFRSDTGRLFGYVNLK